MIGSKLFLEKLRVKLKTGNSRSIHLNALPSRYARLDLFELINIHQSLHLKFLTQLLSKDRFNFKISIDFKLIQKKSEEEVNAAKQIVKKLNSIFYQQQDEFLEHGTKTFAFGYPLLIRRDPSKQGRIFKAPLLIWYLDLTKDTHKTNTWTISRNENHPLIFNEVLRSHIESNEQIKMDDLLEMIDEGSVTESKLLEIAKKCLTKLGTQTSSFDEELLVLPSTNSASIQKLTKEDPWIRWSGVFGLYKTQKQSIIRDIELLRDNEVESVDRTESEIKNLNTASLSVVQTDPSQETILTTINNEDKIVIQGPPGTGKSQSLTAIISNALLNGKSCLVVCEKKTALDVIHENLKEKGLDGLAIIIEDVHQDRKIVIDKVRHLLETRNDSTSSFRANEFQNLLEEHLDTKDFINDYLIAINAKCFGDDKLIDLVALKQRLKQNNKYVEIGFENSSNYNWNYEDFIALKKLLNEAKPIFEPLEKKEIPFDQVVNSYFESRSPNAADFKDDIRLMDKFTTSLLETLNDPLNDNRVFSDLKGFQSFKLKVGKVFSKRLKHIDTAQQHIFTTWDFLTKLFKETRYFLLDFPAIESITKLSELKPSLENLKSLLAPIIEHQDNFSDYIPWRQFLIKTPTSWKPIVLEMQKVPINQWNTSFEIFYLDQFIKKYSQEKNTDCSIQSKINTISASDEIVSDQLSEKILNIWELKQKKMLQSRTISNIKNLYNYRRNKTSSRRNSLRKIIKNDFELFSTAFPILMINPSVCSSILPLKYDLFDIVLFDEASQLRIEDTYAALLRGKKAIVSGDKHQMPPSSYFQSNVVLEHEEEVEETETISDDFLAESDSLLEYCMDSNFESTYLDFHYRSQHPDLIGFSNQAFYGGRLIPMPQQQLYTPISYFNVDGVYNKNRSNPIEAQVLVDYVFNEIQPIENTYPSVGIATFNLNQRNLIWDLLMEKSYESELHEKKLSALIKHGLFVKNLENVQGDERDIILISTTFGPNEEGKFKQLFGPLSQSKGYKLLNVIITRAKQKLAIFTSIPTIAKSGFSEMLLEKGNTGKGILYAYLNYAEAISKNKTQQKENVLESVNKYCYENNYKHEYKKLPLFNQLILTSLVDKYGSADVQHNYSFGGFVIEIAVLKNNRPVVAILTESLPIKNESAYRMLLFKRKMLAQFNIETYFISSFNWNKNWKNEETKLIDFIATQLKS